VRSTQFMELLARIADAGVEDDVVHVPDTRVQPIAAIEVAGFVAAAATRPPWRRGAGSILLPGADARIAGVRLGDWLAREAGRAAV
jgi:hypothetical protein